MRDGRKISFKTFDGKNAEPVFKVGYVVNDFLDNGISYYHVEVETENDKMYTIRIMDVVKYHPWEQSSLQVNTPLEKGYAIQDNKTGEWFCGNAAAGIIDWKASNEDGFGHTIFHNEETAKFQLKILESICTDRFDIEIYEV